jgi:hypothetical protein
MAVISDGGNAGVIVGCSSNYSVVMSLLNIDFQTERQDKIERIFWFIELGRKRLPHAMLS